MFTTETDAVVAGNARYAGDHRDSALPARPARKLAVVTCMDARLDVLPMLGLDIGDAHIIRNAGGVVTEDVIRSLSISQRLLGTRAVALVHHSGCGMLTVTEDFRRSLQDEVGMRPAWAVEAFTDLESDVRQSLARVRTSPFLMDVDDVRGFVLDLASGRLEEVR
ncbi:carbonic anhydrase [Mangrovactinospora gilvigrisea]|uniref:carbonic anhydrase n=1 Tax=Mangrovactinospora gilvigrisea TaxID=1428644 RepID=A0A1J7C9G0_9ACTN|nr:carbonic anhydrase [Mangrovactinospora gilvigrisea]OIV38168.1 carbonic anhydrase [Mangrovactinospora gilvigrisea]